MLAWESSWKNLLLFIVLVPQLKRINNGQGADLAKFKCCQLCNFLLEILLLKSFGHTPYLPIMMHCAKLILVSIMTMLHFSVLIEKLHFLFLHFYSWPIYSRPCQISFCSVTFHYITKYLNISQLAVIIQIIPGRDARMNFGFFYLKE